MRFPVPCSNNKLKPRCNPATPRKPAHDQNGDRPCRHPASGYAVSALAIPAATAGSGPNTERLPAAPVASADRRKFPLRPVRRTALHLAHQIRNGQLGRHRDEHMHVAARQHPAQEADTVLSTDLAANVAHPQTQRPAQHLAAVFGGPHDVIAVAENAVFAGIILHGLTGFPHAKAVPAGSRRVCFRKWILKQWHRGCIDCRSLIGTASHLSDEQVRDERQRTRARGKCRGIMPASSSPANSPASPQRTGQRGEAGRAACAVCRSAAASPNRMRPCVTPQVFSAWISGGTEWQTEA